MRYLIKFIIVVLLSDSAMAQIRVIIPVKEELLQASYAVAMAQVGVVEKTGNNDGDMVEEYQRSVGRNRGDAYCAAGQYWCYWRAALDLGLTIKDIPIKRTGVANDMFNDAVSRGEIGRYSPQKHDLIVWKLKNSFRGHIERIIEIKKYGWVVTIGFNTSNSQTGSQSEGEGVFIKKRNIAHPIGRLKVRGLIGFKNI